MDLNHQILSGDAGRGALVDCSGSFLGFGSAHWAGWRMDHDEKFTTCQDMICVMQDITYRLIFKLSVPKFGIFDVCMIDDNDPDCDIDAVKAIATALRRRIEACPQCADFAFTVPWVARLLDYGSSFCRNAHTSLGDILSVVRVTSTLVEKKHLVGQEAKPRKRGVCIACDEIGGFVFRRLVERAADQTRQSAISVCLGSQFNAYQKSLTELLQQGHGDR